MFDFAIIADFIKGLLQIFKKVYDLFVPKQGEEDTTEN